MADRKINTGLTEAEVRHAFDRALHDLTDAEIQAMLSAEALSRQQTDAALENAVSLLETVLAEAEAEQAVQRASLAGQLNSSAKNLIQITNTAGHETKRGITATYDADAGTVTLNGTHNGTGDATFYLYSGTAAEQKAIAPGSYHLSGCLAGGSTDTYVLVLTYLNAYDSGNGKDFTLTEPGTIAPYIRIRKPADQEVTFDHAVFRPMLCTAADHAVDDTFVPYCPTVPELYGMIRAQQLPESRSAVNAAQRETEAADA